MLLVDSLASGCYDKLISMRKIIIIDSIKGETNFEQRGAYQVEVNLREWLRKNNIDYTLNQIQIICGFKLQGDEKFLSKSSDVSQLAKELGTHGGAKTKKRGSAYYRRIGRLGLAKRYNNPALVGKKRDTPDNAQQLGIKYRE